jgi:hypothetical protein
LSNWSVVAELAHWRGAAAECLDVDGRSKIVRAPKDQVITIDPAAKQDASATSAVLAANRDDPGLFQESPAAVARSRTDFCVARNIAGEIVGCAALHRDSPATVKPEYFSRYAFQPMSRWELPASVLLRKLGQVSHQPGTRWLRTLSGRHTFMRQALKTS